MKRRSFLPLLFFVTTVGCGRSCTCIEGEKTYETLDGKVKVELVRRMKWTGGRLPNNATTFFLRVHTTPPIEHVVRCDHVDLAEDDEGKSVAYRCQGTSTWEVLRLRGKDEYLHDCEPPVGTKSTPELAKLDPVPKAADRIASCILDRVQHRDPSRDLSALVRAIAKDGGDEESARFVGRLASVGIGPTPFVRDRWDVAFEALTPDARTHLAKELCPALADANAPSARYVRAARSCDLDGAPIATAADARFQRGLVDPPEAFTSDQEAFEWAAILASAASGDAACKAVGTLSSNDHRRYPALRLIARTRTRCKPEQRAKMGSPCGSSIVCDAGLCDEAETAKRLAASLEEERSMDGGLRTSDLVPEDGPLTELAALRAQGELPKEIVQRNARLAYEVTPKEGPNCGDDVATGDPCVCSYGFGDTDICSLPLDGGSVLRLSCVLRANDVKKRIEVTRSCAPLLSSCEKLTCCPGYECVTTDAGYARCEESR